ncbi:MAG: hypothetical protein WBB39_05145 [Candidatus Saccharimonadales bacterium]
MKSVLSRGIARLVNVHHVLFASLLLSIAVASATAMAWGPARATFTIDKPASYVTFNSITNNPAHGDERNFMQVRESTADNTTYVDTVSLTAGKEYVVYMYYHNNAAANLNASGTGVANGAYAKAELPAVIKKGADTKAVGRVGATNANPLEVYDDITFRNSTAGDIVLRYVSGSTTIHNFGKTNGAVLPDTILSGGIKLGYDALDGSLPGCNEFAGYITFRVAADQPGLTFTKDVRKMGAKEWSNRVAANVGESVEYRLTYTNTGTTTQNNVVMKDILPKGLSYTTGSSKLYNTSNPGGKAVGDSIDQGGSIIGTYTANANAIYVFGASVTKDAVAVCGDNVITNTASVETSNGNLQDTAEVVVNPACKTEECLPGVPTGDTRCAATSNKLPSTGPVETAITVASLVALTAAAVYWHKSHRQYRRILVGTQPISGYNPSNPDPAHLLGAGQGSKSVDDQIKNKQ